jgi:hypothetical protein
MLDRFDAGKLARGERVGEGLEGEVVHLASRRRQARGERRKGPR